MTTRPPGLALAAQIVAAGLALTSQSVCAQDRASGIEQIQSRQTGIDQLTTSNVARRAQQRSVENAAAGENLSGGPTAGNVQIGLSRRNVVAPGTISDAADSRGTVAMVVGGTDRCDPASETSKQPACRDLIENRSGDFAHAQTATISPESTLLAASQRAGIGTGTLTTTGTTAPTDAEQRGNQELATIVLNQQQQAQAATANSTGQPTLDTNQQAIVNAVVQGITRGN
ncbi:hypothetical protein [Novosphingobium sp.]|uniref:hypothetical protein n=1 Tax=Novosphingobium sp. TaxID=1874826 RepID=UPI0025EBBF81|nr:hypothetical protein [Novosphingobium sp.]